MMQIVPLFPTPLAVIDLDLEPKLQKILLDISIQQKDNKLLNGEKVRDVWSSLSENKQILRIQELKILREIVLQNAKTMANEVMGYDVKDMVDVLSWINEKPGESEHRTHTHPNSFISGVFYYDDEYREGEALVFEKNPGTNAVCQLIPKRNVDIINDFSIVHYSLKPQKGRILLFPSHVPHFVPKGEAGTKRHSISFNLMPTISIGDIQHLTQFQYLSALQT